MEMKCTGNVVRSTVITLYGEGWWLHLWWALMRFQNPIVYKTIQQEKEGIICQHFITLLSLIGILGVPWKPQDFPIAG